MKPPGVERATTVAGLVTLAIGAALTAAPTRTALAMGLGDRPGTARTMGIVDLALAAGLLRGSPRWPWMTARSAFNVLIAAQYRAEYRAGSRRSKARAGAAAMAVLTVVDGALAVALKASGR